MRIKCVIICIAMLIFTSSSVAITNIPSYNLENTNIFSDAPNLIKNTPWKNYPYTPPGTTITFPIDEGKHDPFYEYPVEWWYANFHLTGSITGNEYGAFVAFFKLVNLRVFSISDLSNQKMYTNAKFGKIFASDDKLNINFLCRNDDQITPPLSYQTTTVLNQPVYNQAVIDEMEVQQITTDDLIFQQNEQILGGLDLLQYDYWHTKSDRGKLKPFEYTIMVEGKAQEDNNEKMKLNVEMISLKPPLIVGGDGLVELCDDWSYYYSITKLEVTGNLEVHGISEPVTGYAWIDHQWGNFMDEDFNPPGLSVEYEWFSIKLDDFREILTGDSWRRDTGEKVQSFSDGINILNANGSLEILKDYDLTQLDFWIDDLTGRKYSSKWHLTEDTKPIDLIIIPDIDNQMMQITKNPILLQIVANLMPGGCFWEGSCSVTGVIAGESVSGKAYVELTHTWSNNQANLGEIQNSQSILVSQQSSILSSN